MNYVKIQPRTVAMEGELAIETKPRHAVNMIFAVRLGILTRGFLRAVLAQDNFEGEVHASLLMLHSEGSVAGRGGASDPYNMWWVGWMQA